MKRKLGITLGIILAFIAIACLIPFETTLVPEWRLKVIDEMAIYDDEVCSWLWEDEYHLADGRQFPDD